MEWFRVYTDCLSNWFCFLSLDLFINSFSVCPKKEQQFPSRVFFLFLWGIMSYIPTIPYFLQIEFLLNMAYTFLISQERFRKRFLVFVKYELYYVLGSAVIVILQTLLTRDIYIYTENEIYASYSSVIANFMPYVILSMYIILKKLSPFPSGRIYKRYFLGITGLAVILLVVCSMLLGSTILNQEDIVPLIFSLLLIITLLCISIYRKVITVLEESALAKIEAEKNALEQDYYTHVQESLQTLHLLRHDFKNHMTVLQGYASSGRIEELQHYISRLYDELASGALINTPSPMLSALINAKNEECRRKGVTLTFEQHFSAIYIDDFHMITIFSNLLDNAITAASKCNDGFIRLSITALDSYLEIDCINNHKEQIIEKENRFLTTKTTQKEIHGLGIISVRKAVATLHGEIEIDHTEDRFHVNILVPNYE